MPQILTAFRKFSTAGRGKEYRPKLSIIICGYEFTCAIDIDDTDNSISKRHHAKFFPEKSNFADRNGNTRPGTVVDKGITGV